MKKMISIFTTWISLPLAFTRWIRAEVIEPADEGTDLPPIRYNGDPSEIYLA